MNGFFALANPARFWESLFDMKPTSFLAVLALAALSSCALPPLDASRDATHGNPLDLPGDNATAAELHAKNIRAIRSPYLAW